MSALGRVLYFGLFIIKAEDYLKRETDRSSAYLLHSCSLPNLLKKDQRELLFLHGVQLLKNEHSGCRVLFKDNKVEDLSRMSASAPALFASDVQQERQHLRCRRQRQRGHGKC